MKKLIIVAVMFLAACQFGEVDEHRGLGVSEYELTIQDTENNFTIAEVYEIENYNGKMEYVEIAGDHNVKITIEKTELEEGRITIQVDGILRGYIYYDGNVLDEKYNDNLNLSFDTVD